MINPKSILPNKCFSFAFFDNKIIAAAPVESPEVKNKGPKMALFQSGLALKAESKIPVYTPKTRVKLTISTL